MNNYEVCLIDDHIIPEFQDIDDTKKINEKKLKETLSGEEGWTEHTMKELLESLFKRKEKFNKMTFSAFKRPDFYLNAYQEKSYFKPNLIIFDWDYGSYDTSKDLLTILDKSATNIFILTGNEKISEIKTVLSDAVFQPYKHLIDTFDKTSYDDLENSQEKLVSRIVNDYCNTSEKVLYKDKEIIFYPTEIIPDYDSFWMFESIVSSDLISGNLEELEFKINQYSLEVLIEKSDIKFYKDESDSRIFSNNYESYISAFGNLSEIKGIYAIKNYPLKNLEEAVEKGYSKL